VEITHLCHRLHKLTGSILFSPYSHTCDLLPPSSRVLSSPPAKWAATPPVVSGGRTAGDEPVAAPSASSCYFFPSSWPSSSSSSNLDGADGNGATTAGVGEPTGLMARSGRTPSTRFPWESARPTTRA
jgi:hypothetical protein